MIYPTRSLGLYFVHALFEMSFVICHLKSHLSLKFKGENRSRPPCREGHKISHWSYWIWPSHRASSRTYKWAGHADYSHCRPLTRLLVWWTFSQRKPCFRWCFYAVQFLSGRNIFLILVYHVIYRGVARNGWWQKALYYRWICKWAGIPVFQWNSSRCKWDRCK